MLQGQGQLGSGVWEEYAAGTAGPDSAQKEAVSLGWERAPQGQASLGVMYPLAVGEIEVQKGLGRGRRWDRECIHDLLTPWVELTPVFHA